MRGQPEAIAWVERLGNRKNVVLLPYLAQDQLWDLFRRAQITISISEHDGTPNSLLEAMACGCFPIAGDIESLREWITPGLNGSLVNPTNPGALADAVIDALQKPELRARAAETNRGIITERAEIGLMRTRVKDFYQQFNPT
jgi:glycosyltransferase involved in cell wall biosynthesis